MSHFRHILGCVALSWLMAIGLASPAWSQIRAMPLNTVKVMLPLLEDSAVESPPQYDASGYGASGYDASLDNASLDNASFDDQSPGSSAVLQRMSYLEDAPATSSSPVTPVVPVTYSTPANQATCTPDDAAGYLVSPIYPNDCAPPLDMGIECPTSDIYGPQRFGQEIYGGAGGGLWTWQPFPDGLIYKSYMAGGRESRFASQWVHERDQGWLWDITLGGRVGLLRFGTQNDIWPEGWQLDIEGAAFPRLSLERTRDMDATDFRFGVPLTFRRGIFEGKFSYYHLSSHLGDEFIETFNASRINFVRDVLVLGVGVWAFPDMRLYSEAGWSFRDRGGSEPWEFQFGVDWCSPEPTDVWGGPFFAANCRLRQELDFGGNMTIQNGWQWRGDSGHFMRIGMQYFNGQSDQYQFFTEHEEQLGVGLWYDY